jgi:hypothetical protein
MSKKNNASSSQHFPHARPNFVRLQQIFALFLLVIIPVASLLLLWLALSLGAFLFALMVPFLLWLVLPMVMLTSATPPVTVHEDGITLHPRWWRERFIAWDDIEALRDYPLLPRRDTEVERRALQGRKQYQVARGVMLVVPHLSLPYRVTGFFAGLRGRSVVAFTNRAHDNYDRLEKMLGRALAHCDERAHDEN